MRPFIGYCNCVASQVTLRQVSRHPTMCINEQETCIEYGPIEMSNFLMSNILSD